MSVNRIGSILLVLLLCAGYGISHTRMVTVRRDLPPETRRAEAMALDPTLLKIVSGPFKGLTADYMMVKASVFMGGAWDVTDEDWNAVYTLFKQSLHLDPLFFQTGYYIQGLLSWRKGMQYKAIELLTYHAEQRYWDWEPMFYLGFDYFYYLKDNEQAAKYMRLSAERPGAPPIVANLAARLSHRSGQTVTAIAMLKSMVERTEEGKLKDQYTKRLEAHLAVYAIEQAIERFERENQRKPDSLKELISSGTLSELPVNPYGNHFLYEADSGRVFFDAQR
jgi:hypothetical protein